MLREPFSFHPFSFFQSRSSSSRSSFIPFRLRLNLVVLLAVVVMVILEEEVLIGAVSSKSDGGPTQTGEKALEAVPSSEGTGVSPSLAGGGISTSAKTIRSGIINAYCRAHGSFFAQMELGEAAALNSFISKPVGLRWTIVGDVCRETAD